ncbi:uncharacterized protein TNCV_3836851 [Trichonephila clavipes]|nr:uncharacterized protein TNCV_3836851 [Trichonephila clavipes]
MLWEMFIHIPSHVIMEMRKPQATEGTNCLLWSGGRQFDNFVHTGKADISKPGVSSSFLANFHYSLHTGYLEKIRTKGYILFRASWDKVLVLPLPRDLVELRRWIRNEFAAVARDMLKRVWTEMSIG